MNNLDWDDICDYNGPTYVREENRYEKVRGHMDDLIVELYGRLKTNWDLNEIHYLISLIAGEMDLYIPENELKPKKIA